RKVVCRDLVAVLARQCGFRQRFHCAGFGKVISALADDSMPALPRARLPRLASSVRDLLSSGGDLRAEGDWVKSILNSGEMELWRSMAPVDRHHGLRVACGLTRRLAGSRHADDPRWIAAALLHDVGKTTAALAPVHRAFAAIVGRIVTIRTATRWASHGTDGIGRIGRYLLHGQLARMRSGRPAAATKRHRGPRFIKLSFIDKSERSRCSI